jgi:hypothetical protein
MKLQPTAERNHAGAWVVSDVVAGYWVTRVYYGYTKRESLTRFKQEMKGAN